jgi:Putative beta barrel porin-7 (BBP7)
MRNAILVSGLLSLVSALPLSAQSPPPGSGPTATLEFKDANPPILESMPAARESYRVWASGEYLLWWTKNAPSAILVTTGSAADAFPGALGQAGTRTLFGGSGFDAGATSGFRVTIGGWNDRECGIGLEASGFMLQQRSAGFHAASDPTGNPSLYLPVFRADLGREGTYRIADPTFGLNGRVAIGAQTQLWGAEINGLANLVRNNCLTVDLIGGFRYAGLAEDLTVNTVSNDTVNVFTDLTTDRFATRNHFYGGQLGLRAGYLFGRASLDVSGKVALGVTHESVDISGSTFEAGPGAVTPGLFPGGVFSQRTNIGTSSRNPFAVMPEVQVKLGYLITPNVKAFVGYDFLYWSQVVRPGSQVDRSINPTQTFGGALTGVPAPVPLFNRTDYWAQGVSFGLEFRY